MITNKSLGRISGLLYLTVVLTGIFSLLYVPSQLNVSGDGAATIANIARSETLFRLGILAAFVCYLAFLFLPIVLFKLLSPFGRAWAYAMVILATVSVPISIANLLNRFAVLTLLDSNGGTNAQWSEALQNQAMFHLQQYSNGIALTSVFWGLWLLPFGFLVFKSRILPRSLGILLMLGCFGYLANFLGNFLIKDYSALGVSGLVALPASIGEIGTCLWLLFFGAKETPAIERLTQDQLSNT